MSRGKFIDTDSFLREQILSSKKIFRTKFEIQIAIIFLCILVRELAGGNEQVTFTVATTSEEEYFSMLDRHSKGL